MKIITVIITCVFSVIAVYSQQIYSKTYGSPSNEPLIFLHGGPGYNSIAFEVSTAQKLADAGFYVVVYDRRGEGRSKDKNAEFTFKESFADLDALYDKFEIQKASLIGHSFGGVLGTLYAEEYPMKVKSVVLVATPLSMQETLSTIIETSKKIYQKNKDSTNLRYINMLENMDNKSLEYASYSFGHAMQNGFYSPKSPSNSASNIYGNLNSNKSYQKEGKTMTTDAPQGFWENEDYTTISINQNLKRLKRNSIQVYGLYGQEDGLYSKSHIEKIKNIIPQENFEYFKNCSHNVFIDQQEKFIRFLKNWIH